MPAPFPGRLPFPLRRPPGKPSSPPVHWLRALLACTLAVLFLLLPNSSGQTTARDIAEGRGIAASDWSLDPELPHDVFTFVRLRHNSAWATDFPNSDLNFSFRLQELTSLEVDPDGRVIDVGSRLLFDYPFVFMSNPHDLNLTSREAQNLRDYLLNGGFLMVDDFWGNRMWEVFTREMQKVLPGQKPRELSLEHAIFHCVFDLDKIPQVPSHDAAERGRELGYTYEDTIPEPPENLDTPHFMAWHDKDGRMIVLACHNNDIADAWEEENYQLWFFKEFSERWSYPIGINILFYAMTH